MKPSRRNTARAQAKAEARKNGPPKLSKFAAKQARQTKEGVECNRS